MVKGKVNMIYTHKTRLSCDEIVSRIEEDAKQFGLMMKKHYPFSENLPESGFEINEYSSVFELCKPSIAAKVLNTQPQLNVFMPCRISVYEKDGVAFVSTPDLEVQLELLGYTITLKDEMLDLYHQIITMIKKW